MTLVNRCAPAPWQTWNVQIDVGGSALVDTDDPLRNIAHSDFYGPLANLPYFSLFVVVCLFGGSALLDMDDPPSNIWFRCAAFRWLRCWQMMTSLDEALGNTSCTAVM